MQLPLSQQMFDRGNLRLREHLNVWYFLPPADTKDGLKTTNMESLKRLDVTSVRGPCFAAVQQCQDTSSLVGMARSRFTTTTSNSSMIKNLHSKSPENQQETHHEMRIPERDVTYIVLSV